MESSLATLSPSDKGGESLVSSSSATGPGEAREESSASDPKWDER